MAEVLFDGPTRALVEQYYDAVPRSRAEAHDVGPFVLFVRRGEAGHHWYARPRYGLTEAIRAEEVAALIELMGKIGVPELLEWVGEITPSLAEAAAGAGMTVEARPLMMLGHPRGDRHEPDLAVLTALLPAKDPRIDEVLGAIDAAFGVDDEGNPGDRRGLAAAVNSGEKRLVGAWLHDADGQPTDCVGGGFHTPVDRTTELTGIAIRPRARGRGAGARVTLHLMADAIAGGMRSIFLSATDEDAARVYARLGFERLGTAYSARLPG